MQKRPSGLWLTTCSKPKQSIVSIMQKRPPVPWLTPCSKHKQFHCQHHVEKTSWTQTYRLFNTQSSPLSAPCRKGHLDPDLQAVQSPEQPLSASWKWPLGPLLTACSNPDHSLSASCNIELDFCLQYVETNLIYPWLLLIAPLHPLTISLENQT